MAVLGVCCECALKLLHVLRLTHMSLNMLCPNYALRIMGMLCGYECATPIQPLYAMNMLLVPVDVRCDPLNLMARMRYECAADIVL